MTVATMPPDIVRRLATARLIGLVFAAVIAVLCTSGLAAKLLFDQPSLVKYAATVVAAGYLIVVIASPKPLLTMTVVTVIIAPFSAQATFGPVMLTMGFAGLVPALLLHAANRATPWQSVGARTSSLAVAVPVAAAVMTVPLLESAHPLAAALTIFTMVGTGWLVAAVSKDRANRRWVVGAVVVAAGLQAALAARELVTGRPLALYGQTAAYTSDYFFRYGSDTAGYVFRPSGGLTDPNSLGNVLAVSCPLILALVMTLKDRKVRFLVGGTGCLVLAGLAGTLSRMSWVAAAGGVLLTIALLPPRKVVRAVAVVALGALPALAVALTLAGGSLADRAATVLNPTATTTAGRQEDLTRLALWHAAVDVTSEHPFFGVGLGKLPRT